MQERQIPIEKEEILGKRKQYREATKEKIKAHAKEYREKNKDNLRERNGQKIACDNCGTVVTRSNSDQHKMSLKCNCKQVDPKDFNFNKVKL